MEEAANITASASMQAKNASTAFASRFLIGLETAAGKRVRSNIHALSQGGWDSFGVVLESDWHGLCAHVCVFACVLLLVYAMHARHAKRGAHSMQERRT